MTHYLSDTITKDYLLAAVGHPSTEAEDHDLLDYLLLVIPFIHSLEDGSCPTVLYSTETRLDRASSGSLLRHPQDQEPT